MILKLAREINREVRSTVRKICVCACACACACACVCDIDVVEQNKAYCPCHFHYQQSCYPCHFIFSSESDMSVLSTLFKFGRLSSILL